jgi:response regulator RpfG family c-di-GMP phosphodiesterase
MKEGTQNIMSEKILLVDDDLNVLLAYRRHIQNKFNVIIAESGTKGIAALKEQGPFAVVVSDYRMPGMDGIQFLSQSRQLAPDTVRIMFTGHADVENAVNAINEGNIFRFLTKPCTPEVFIKALTAGVEQYQLVTGERDLLEKTLKGSIKVLTDILSILSPAAHWQVSRLGRMAKKLAMRLQVDKLWEVELAAMFSQIGCITIPEEIIEKKIKGMVLSEDENKMFLDYPLIGAQLLSNIPRLEEIAEAIKYHLKRFDGGGVTGEESGNTALPLISRILKVAVDFDIIRAEGNSAAKTLEIMSGRSGWYDPDVLAALEKEIMDSGKIRTIPLTEILPGMVLVDDIMEDSGVVLVKKGNEVTDVLKMRVLNYAKYRPVIDKIRVMMPGGKSSNEY